MLTAITLIWQMEWRRAHGLAPNQPQMITEIVGITDFTHKKSRRMHLFGNNIAFVSPRLHAQTFSYILH
ncbi:MAG: hypothetical protein WCD24_05370, partial [Serratia inhibens]|uniref:hypothetical protein n=1 Tax=Serratia inhibens TaxID=2338073 RepID=UPI003C7B795A